MKEYKNLIDDDYEIEDYSEDILLNKEISLEELKEENSETTLEVKKKPQRKQKKLFDEVTSTTDKKKRLRVLLDNTLYMVLFEHCLSKHCSVSSFISSILTDALSKQSVLAKHEDISDARVELFIRLTEKLFVKLKICSKLSGISQSEYIEVLLKKYFDK